ncbi:MAG: hypothetical protein A2V66_00910 [Ignavibacteria bacterium RBG_13_36_8]|nr:MAG: hypothetical protein A2V66_00910 [Ignavibacteria bacterium RBG_13_36_8]
MKIVRNMFSAVVILISCPVMLWAGEVDNLIIKGNELYQNNQFADAIVVYQQVLEKGYESEALYYNLGNAYYRTGKLGYAILFYEKALKLAPDDEDINYNLLISNARTVDKIKELPKLFFVEWWEVLVTSLTVNGWLTLLIIFYYLLLVAVGAYFLVKRFQFQHYLLYWGTVNIVILLLFSLFLFARISRDESFDYGILIESTVTAKQSPNEKSGDVFVVHEGIKFEIEDQLDNWAKIKLADGKVGWLPENCFEKI